MAEEKDCFPNKFNEQAYLLHFYDLFSKQNESFTYRNFTRIMGTPASTLNTLLGTGAESMFSLSPAQLSMLHPKLKLYIVKYGSNGEEYSWQLRFGDYNDIFIKNSSTSEDMLHGRGENGAGVGLKKFEWEDMGSTPGDQGKQFKATLEIYFQSMADLFAEQKGNVSFAHLIRSPAKLKDKRGAYDSKAFRIKVELGWEVPTNLHTLFPGVDTQKIRKSLEASSVVMFLNLAEHDINLEENGNVRLVATYIGAIEGKLLSAETDLFYVEKKRAERLKVVESSLNNLQKQKKDAELRKQKEENGPGFFTKVARNIEKEGNLNAFGDAFGELFYSEENDIKNAEEIFQKQMEDMQLENREIAYRRLLDNIERNGRIFFVDVSRNKIENFNKLKYDTFSKDQEERKAAALRKYTLSNKPQQSSFQSYNSSDPNSDSVQKMIKSDIKKLHEAAKSEDEDDLEKAVQYLSQTNVQKGTDMARINFIFFGDLIESAMQVIKDQEFLADDPIEAAEIGRFNFLMGSIELYNPLTDNTEVVNLADIPISFEIFNIWFTRNVIKPQKNSYLLREFLKESFSELVLRALSTEYLGPYVRAVQNNISFSTFSFDSFGDSEPIAGGLDRINIEDGLNQEVQNKLIDLRRYKNQSGLNEAKTYSYLLFHVQSFNKNKFRGIPSEDEKRGIYHFTIGQDRGLVKKINFSKADISYLREERITNSNLSKNGDYFISEPYNATVNLFGISLFKNGMFVYINVPNVPSTIKDPVSREDVRLDNPFGGYYNITKVTGLIEPGKFDISLTCNWVSSKGDKK